MEPVELKAHLLSDGVVFSKSFLSNYGLPYLEKRRAYGNPDPVRMRNVRIPQELYVGEQKLVTSINARPGSPWKLEWDGAFGVTGPGVDWMELDFPRRPEFYETRMERGEAVSRYITLYGGGALGLFIYGNCALVDIGKACHYCSIAPNRQTDVDFEKVISSAQVEEAVSLALRDTEAPISQVMVNGGNFQEPDKSFCYYASICSAARKAIDASGRKVDLHLIVFPPADLRLFELLTQLDLCLAMNCEVFTPDLFESYCPGKAATAGQHHIFRALRSAVLTLGKGRVYSIIVGGLEPLEATARGMVELASWGVTPVINVFHADPGTPLASRAAPKFTEIMEMGAALQEVFVANGFMQPFYMNCGRNSLDTEASRRLFKPTDIGGRVLQAI